MTKPPKAHHPAFLSLALGIAFASPALAGSSADVVGIDQTAPIISRHEIDIQAPVEVVWEIQTDINAWPQWRSAVSSASFEDTLKPGAVFKWEDSGLKITSTIRQVIPHRRIVWTGPAQGINAVHVWEFTTTATGVHVHTEESWNGDGLQAQAEKLQPLLDQSLKSWLSLLKARSEAVQATGASPRKD